MRSAKFSDTELLNGLVSRDEAILKEYYSIYSQSVRQFVLSNNGNEEDARDLFQDVMMVLFQKARDERFKLTCSLGTYIYSVSRFLWLKELGKRKWKSQQVVDYEEIADTESDIVLISEKNERLMFYRNCFEKLSESCRKVLKFFAEGYSISEITVLMGFSSEQHTKNRRYRCKLSLIHAIEAECVN